MKELTVEEKAQRYDEAIEKFSVILNLDIVKESGTIFADDVRKILPELEENSDEKVRRWLIEVVEEIRKASPDADHNGMYSKAKAWLEEQGDKDKLIKELGEYKAKYTQEVLGKYISNKDDERLRKTTIAFLKESADKGYENAVECIDWLGKQQSKQKSYWKPTEEQYEALDYAYNSCSDTERGNYYEGVLESLIEDLHELEKQQDNNEDSNILQRFSFYSYKDEPNILYLSGLYVNEECRNKGIGTRILEVADEVAKSLNCHAIRLKTKKDSNAEKLYRAYGYNSLATEEKDEIWLEKQGEVRSSSKNEEEKIREELVQFIKSKTNYPAEWIDWIEKQGDHANFRNKIQVGDKVTRNKDGVLVNLSQLDRVAKKPEPEKTNPWSREDEKIVRALISMCTEWLVEKSFTPSENKDIETIKTWLSELKERVYPPREKDWSSEDEDKQHLTNLLTILEDHGYREADVLNRIKKQDWSEIDERILKKVITLLKMFKKEPSEKLRKEYQKEIDWLNSKIFKLGEIFEVKNKIS